MAIAMIGTGYVGLVSGACFSEFGAEVVCVDVDADKISLLERGEIPIMSRDLMNWSPGMCAPNVFPLRQISRRPSVLRMLCSSLSGPPVGAATAMLICNSCSMRRNKLPTPWMAIP